MDEITTTAAGIGFLRTPEERFDVVVGFDYEPKYLDIEGLRMAYILSLIHI